MCKSQNGYGLLTFLVITLLVLLTGMLISGGYLYQKYKNGELLPATAIETPTTTIMEPQITLEERVTEWKMEVTNDKEYQTYLELPELILRELLQNLGPNAAVSTIVGNYNANITYYLSKYLQDSFKPELSGKDAKNIERVEIKTVLKEPEKTTTSVPIVATDSLK